MLTCSSSFVRERSSKTRTRSRRKVMAKTAYTSQQVGTARIWSNICSKRTQNWRTCQTRPRMRHRSSMLSRSTSQRLTDYHWCQCSYSTRRGWIWITWTQIRRQCMRHMRVMMCNWSLGPVLEQPTIKLPRWLRTKQSRCSPRSDWAMRRDRSRMISATQNL